MEVTFLEKQPVTDSMIYGIIRRQYTDEISTIIGVLALKYPSAHREGLAVVAMNHFATSEDDEDGYPCELLETTCRVISNKRLSSYLEAYSFTVKSLLIYYGMREDEKET